MKENKRYFYFFPKLPFCVIKDELVRDDFLENVNRVNAKTKCQDLTTKSDFLLIQLKMDYFFKEELGPFIGLFFRHVLMWKQWLQYLAYIVNILIILSY